MVSSAQLSSFDPLWQLIAVLLHFKLDNWGNFASAAEFATLYRILSFFPWHHTINTPLPQQQPPTSAFIQIRYIGLCNISNASSQTSSPRPDLVFIWVKREFRKDLPKQFLLNTKTPSTIYLNTYLGAHLNRSGKARCERDPTTIVLVRSSGIINWIHWP